jgi:cysteamine dioxygenase
MGAKGVAALMASVSALPACRTSAMGVADPSPGLTGAKRMDWTAFLESLAAMAQEQFSPDWDQQSHVRDVQKLMGLLELDDAHFEALYDGYSSSMSGFPELNSIHETEHFEVATVEFDAGDSIPLHNHPDMTGVIQCLVGAVRVEAFNLLDQPSANGKLKLKRVNDGVLRPGDFSTLTVANGNIHALVAEEHTALLDVFTPPYNKERLRRYRWYGRSEQPIEGSDVFEAWTV